MTLSKHEVDIATGRRAADGHVRASLFADGLLALTLEGHGERAPTLLLTLEQARKLEDALAELIRLAEDEQSPKRTSDDARTSSSWKGEDRRRTSGALK
jgi:hypothetical protein